MPRAIEVAIEEDVDFRRGLPIDYLDYMGLVNSDLVLMFTHTLRNQFLKPIVFIVL